MTDHGLGSDRLGDIPEAEDRWLLVAVAGALSFVAMLDMNIVNVALADISRGLHVSAATAQWAVLGYQLPVVALLLPVGRWLDGTGMRVALLTATGGFAVCSAAAAVSPWAAWLIAARIAQGAFGAALFVLMPVLALRSVRPEVRGRAMSVPATLGPLGAVTGPAVGGLLLDHLGWRAVFLVKIPVCVLALGVAWRAMPKDGRPHRPDQRSLADALLIATGVTILLLALTLASETPSWLLLALAALPPLWWWLRGPGGRPVTEVEQYGDVLFAVKTVAYVEHEELTATSEVVNTGEIMVFAGPDFVVTVRHGRHGSLGPLREDLEADARQLAKGPAAVLHAIADHVVDDATACLVIHRGFKRNGWL